MNFRLAALFGISWSMASQATRMALQIATTILLARLLTPDDFGVYAMAMPVIGLAGLLQDVGLHQAIMQKDKISKDQLNTVFWLNFLISLGVALLLVLVSPLVGRFYADPRLVGLVASFGVIVMLGSLTFGQYAMLGRDLRFRVVALIDIVCALVSFVTVIGVSYFWPSYWALWSAGLASVLCWSVLTFLVGSWRPGIPKRGGDLDGMFRFGLNIMFHNFANYASRNVDNILIGRSLGGAVLGYYDRAYKLLLYPLENLANPVTRVMVPLLSRMQGDQEGFRRAFLQSSGLVNLACIPGMAVAIACSHDLVRILLGERWLPVAPIFYWLGFAGLVQPIVNSSSWLFIAQGRSGDMVRVSVTSSLVIVAGFFIGLGWGAEGVACAYAISECFFRVPLTIYLGGRKGAVRASDLLWGILPLMGSALATLLSVSWLYQSGVSGWKVILLALPIAYGQAVLTLCLFPAGRKLLADTGRAAASFYESIRNREQSQ